MLNYGDYAYQTGLIDTHGWRSMKIFEYLAKEHINDAYGKVVRICPFKPIVARNFYTSNLCFSIGMLSYPHLSTRAIIRMCTTFSSQRLYSSIHTLCS